MRISQIHHDIAKGDYPVCIKAPILILSGWLFQGILYMDKTEKVFKLTLDLLLTMIFMLVGISLIESIVISHTINWIFNGQVWVIFKNLKTLRTPKRKFKKYLTRLRIHVGSEPSIVWAGVYGSLVRGEFKETSDLDVRLIRKPGLINGVRACIFVMKERTWATFHKFPLDIYVGDNFGFIQRMNEQPTIIYKIEEVRQN